MVITKLILKRDSHPGVTQAIKTHCCDGCVTCWQEKRLASLWAENKRIEAMA